MKRQFLLAATFACGLLAGCAKPLIADATQLGSVIVYRNGVAYFERYAEKSDKSLTLHVPDDRVDDFLKSLSIVDEETGKALPVSYPTLAAGDGYVNMTITLPPHTGRLRINYVTESPAWKPSYRVVLSPDGKAKLQGWAVIDNVSGEDWKKVKIGVGSTSALSFRYDLHSVRLVERETLGGGGELALAPPTGGTPYAVAEKKVRLLGNLSANDVVSLNGRDQTATLGALSAGVATPTTIPGPGQAGQYQYPQAAQQPPGGAANVYRLAEQLKAGAHRVRIEGYGQAGDANPQQASLDRANTVRDMLVGQGIAADRIDVVGTGKMNSANAVSVLASDEPVAPTEAKGSEKAVAAKDTQPVGQAYFVSDKAMSIAADHSAMVSILNAGTDAKRVYFYDPISERGSKTFAFSAVRIANPTEYTLDGGPFTVYAEGQFLGEGLSEPILPKSVAFIPYALDRSVVVDTAEDTREEIDKLVTVERGIGTTETRRIRRTRLTIANRGQEAAEVYVRHQVATGFSLDVAEGTRVERLGGANLFPVSVAAGSAVELVIEEHTPLMKTVDLRTDVGVRDVSLFLSTRTVDAELKKKLSDIVEAHKNAENLEERIHSQEEQLGVFRTRVDELSAQLASLKKVPQSEKLRQNLQLKMEEISNKLQKGTIDTTDLEGQLMTVRIALQDKLADLTLEREDKPRKVADK